jgi:hypothetical protein
VAGGRHVAEDDTWKERDTRHNGCTCGGRRTWNEAGHMAGSGWMVKWERDHVN